MYPLTNVHYLQNFSINNYNSLNYLKRIDMQKVYDLR